MPRKNTATDADSAAKPSQSFEEGVRRLGEIVQRLEAGELPLEESLSLFEEGVGLVRDAQRRLEDAERRVEQLLSFDAEGKPVTRDFEG